MALVALLGFFLNPTPLCQPLPRELGLAIIQESSILSTNEPYFTETQIYANLLSGVDLVIAEIAQYDWDINMALKIVKCESGFKEKVISHTNDVGIFQINLSAHGKVIPGETREEKIEWLQDYHNNIYFAYQLYSKHKSWNDWVCFNKNMLGY